MSGRALYAKSALTLCLALVLLAGCAPAPAQAAPEAERTFFAMDTVMTLRLYQGGSGETLERAEDRVREFEALWSVTDENSEIRALNRDGRARLSQPTADLLDQALGLCARTDGALDISVYPVLRTWGFTTGAYSVPNDETIAALLPLVDYGQIRLEGSAAALPPGMEIDLGSVAKGYTGDVLSAYLKENGVTSALLDLGGNIQAVGSKRDGSPWRVAIRNPAGEGSIGVVEARDRAVVTSGGYERYFEQAGIRYWHILDPQTGAPVRNGLASVTVVGDSGLTCDGLSTALFVMGLEDALDHWRLHRDFEAVFVLEDGSVTITAGLEGSFSLSRSDRSLTVVQP